MKFTPTPEQIRAAELLFVVIARYQAVAEAVAAYETEILERLQVQPDRELGSMAGFAPDQVINDPKRVYLMGASDRTRFHAERHKAMVKANLVPKPPYDCPLLEVEALRTQARRHLIELMAPAVGLEAKLIRRMSLSQEERFADISLKLLASHVRGAREVLESLVAAA